MADKTDTANLQPLRVGDAGIPVDLSVFIVAADAGGKAAVPAAAVLLLVWVAVGGAGAVCGCFAGLLVDCKKCKHTAAPSKSKKLSVSCFFKYLLLSIGLLFLFNLIGTAVNELLSQLKGSPAGNLIEQSVGSYTLWQMVLVTVISAPLGEELLFRKLVYRCVGAYSVKAYVFTSACLFMLMHGNVVEYPYVFALGGLFAWVYCKTGSLRNTILLHACVNFIGGVIPYLAGRVNWCCRCWECSILLGAAYVGYTLWRCRGRHPLQNDPKLPEGASDAALLNVGMLLFTAPPLRWQAM